MPISAEQNKEMRTLIQAQAEAAVSATLCERLGTCFVLSAQLRKYLKLLSDRQLAQLTLDVVWGRLPCLHPEATILGEAVARLMRSSRGAPSEIQENLPPDHRKCKGCGREMVLEVGIGEPDRWICEFIECGYRKPVRENPGDCSGAGGVTFR